MFAGSLDGVIQVFNVETGDCLGVMRKKAKCKNMEFSYGDRHLAVVIKLNYI
jgi:hypothetical protein